MTARIEKTEMTACSERSLISFAVLALLLAAAGCGQSAGSATARAGFRGR
jgi:hypothetical protein